MKLEKENLFTKIQIQKVTMNLNLNIFQENLKLEEGPRSLAKGPPVISAGKKLLFQRPGVKSAEHSKASFVGNAS